MSDNLLASFEEVIGYTFKNKKFLKIALTHKSYIDEHPTYESTSDMNFLAMQF